MDEARLYDDWQLPPLTQSLEELRTDIVETVVLKACVSGRIVGSVRGRRVEAGCYIGRLLVHPERRRQGIATCLMREIETFFTDARFELFTGAKSTGSLRLYQGLGYTEVRREIQSEKVTLVLFEKPRPANAR